MPVIEVEILNRKALKLLELLESFKLIRLKRDSATEEKVDWSRLRGAMAKESPEDIDKKVVALRGEWE